MTAPLFGSTSGSTPTGARRGEGLSLLTLHAGLQGLPDPVAAADELLAIDAETLAGWFTVARRAAVWLWRGADVLADAIPALAAAWSSPTPRASITALREAAVASRTVVVGQADAADLACGGRGAQTRVGQRASEHLAGAVPTQRVGCLIRDLRCPAEQWGVNGQISGQSRHCALVVRHRRPLNRVRPRDRSRASRRCDGAPPTARQVVVEPCCGQNSGMGTTRGA